MCVALVKGNVGHKCGFVVEWMVPAGEGAVSGGALPTGTKDQVSAGTEQPSNTPGFGIGMLIVAMMFAALTC